MSTSNRKLTKDEIKRMFAEDSPPFVPHVLTTEEAAELFNVKPKTMNAWKNAGLLEGTYRTRQSRDHYLRDRLVEHFFNGPEWNNGKETEKK